MKVLELFGGIGACSKALENLGIDFEIVDYVEIDKYAVKSFNALHGTDFVPQDICSWDKELEVDLLMHGSPCQDISIAGHQAGADEGSGTRSSLMYETLRIIEKVYPKYVVWENVRNLLGKSHFHNFKAYLDKMEELGYVNYYKLLNARDFGIPQNRERVFTVSIRKDLDKGYSFPEGRALTLKLKDMLEEKVDEKYYLSDKMKKYISMSGTKGFRNNDCVINLDIARPLTTEQNKRAGTTNYLSKDLPDNYDLRDIYKPRVVGGIGEKKSNGGAQWYQQDRIYDNKIVISVTTSFNPYYLDGVNIRRLTPREAWRLMGFSDSDFDKVKDINSNAQLYKQAGNSIVVNVLEAVLFNLFGK